MSPELTELLTKASTDPDTLSAYIDDPAATMTDAGVPEDEQELMLKNDFTKFTNPILTMMVFIIWLVPHDSNPDGSN